MVINENMRDDKILRLISMHSIVGVLSHIYVSCEIGNCQRKKKNILRISEPSWEEKWAKEGKVDGDKADAIITIFFFTRTIYPAGNYTHSVDRVSRSVVLLNAGRFSFTNRPPFSFRSAS